MLSEHHEPATPSTTASATDSNTVNEVQVPPTSYEGRLEVEHCDGFSDRGGKLGFLSFLVAKRFHIMRKDVLASHASAQFGMSTSCVVLGFR